MKPRTRPKGRVCRVQKGRGWTPALLLGQLETFSFLQSSSKSSYPKIYLKQDENTHPPQGSGVHGAKGVWVHPNSIVIADKDT